MIVIIVLEVVKVFVTRVVLVSVHARRSMGLVSVRELKKLVLKL